MHQWLLLHYSSFKCLQIMNFWRNSLMNSCCYEYGKEYVLMIYSMYLLIMMKLIRIYKAVIPNIVFRIITLETLRMCISLIQNLLPRGFVSFIRICSVPQILRPTRIFKIFATLIFWLTGEWFSFSEQKLKLDNRYEGSFYYFWMPWMFEIEQKCIYQR